MTTITRLAGMTDVPNPHPDPESQTQHTVTPRRSRASLPPSRRPSHRSLHSAKSRSSLGPAPTADLPPLPTNPRYSQRYADTPATTTTGTSAAWTSQVSTAPRFSHTTTTNLDSTTTGGSQGASDDEDDAADIAWGPAHPCFPHPNPHVPRDSPECETTRIVRVQRDWLVAGDAYPAFANLYPEILADWIGEAEFRVLVGGINDRLKEAFKPDGARAVVDALLGVATGFLWDDAGWSGAKRGVKELERYMEQWNEERKKEGNPVRLIPLRRTGFMNLDIQIPDPGIDIVED
ncbi:hypothetical protein K461DRAFT_317466 [Myriangium duriaei CBS 260.36]|uniref:Ras modification protein ERF4 n=1 Tax=Myriangium duriaei CBS 260.36 TaxID=1168546 RepID=A0A9P4J9K1_9PEZI|nr:hypothetical protein K461DRAFT_317466 [Myriangium duriaei CBS 260.36]